MTYSANLDRNTSRLKRLKRGTRYEHGREKGTRTTIRTETERERIRTKTKKKVTMTGKVKQEQGQYKKRAVEEVKGKIKELTRSRTIGN